MKSRTGARHQYEAAVANWVVGSRANRPKIVDPILADGLHRYRPKMGRQVRGSIGVVMAICLGGCTGSGARDVPSCGDAGCGWAPVVTTSFERGAAMSGSGPIAVLFVIDDSPAMAGVAGGLAAQYSMFAQVFQGFPVGTPPLHAAFISATVPSSDCTSPGPRGAICGLTSPDQFLSAEYCGADPNSSGSLDDTFACLGSFGAQGCGMPQPLEAARRALGGDPSGGALFGQTPFVNPAAQLVIVFVTAEDDASVQNGALVPIEDYLRFFGGLTVSPYNSLFISVIGPEGCPSAGAVAPVPTPRLDQLAAAVGDNGESTSICDPSLTSALAAATARLGWLITAPCLDGIRDTDLSTPGVQADCTVEDTIIQSDGSQMTTTLSICDPVTPVPPCLSFLAANDPLNSCSSLGQALIIQRPPIAAGACGPYSTRDRVTCATCADPADPTCAGP
ncbi:MAG TPA: hypothetical protein VFG23_02370 [Polyangia bacterium]|nr:hypothetical protein [Polyangia bacterium]